jgi:hypothetical protein
MRQNTMNETGNIDESCAIAVPAEPAFGKWQPIETAPKDGTEVLIFEKGHEFGYDYAIGKFVKPRWAGDEVGGWSNRNSTTEYNHPTHWQHLEPPK